LIIIRKFMKKSLIATANNVTNIIPILVTNYAPNLATSYSFLSNQ